MEFPNNLENSETFLQEFEGNSGKFWGKARIKWTGNWGTSCNPENFILDFINASSSSDKFSISDAN